MSFLEHWGELRWALLRAFAAMAAGAGIAAVFAPRLLELIMSPYGGPLITIEPAEGIAGYLRICVTAGTVIAMPYILFEAWRFVSPALKPVERRLVFIFLPAAVVLFLAGAAFAWFVLIPAAVRFLSGFTLGVFRNEWTARSYIRFVTGLVFWVGACFELPLLMFFAARTGLVRPRTLLRGWRYAVVLILVLAAVITPTVDPFNMMLVSLPMIGLYFFGVLLAAAAVGRR